jgi:phage tail tape measure protein, TP901 family, core region
MADEKTVWQFEIQQGNTLTVLKKLDAMLLSVKQRFDQVAQDGAKMANSFNATSSSMLNLASKASSAGQSVSVLDNAQAKASESAKRMEARMQNLSSSFADQSEKSIILTQGMDRARESVNKLGSIASSVAKIVVAGLAAAFAALAVAVATAIPKAMDFDATLRKINALAGVSKDALAGISDEILRMAGKVGKGPQDLAEGLYYVSSSGFSAKMSMIILEASARAAAVGMTATQIVANGLTAVLKSFPGMSVAKAIDEMTKTVSTGKTEWADYANVVGEVTLAASQANVAFEESQAAFAVLTNVMPSSEQAATSLRALLLTSSQFGQLSDRARSLGLAFDENSYKSMNFIDRLRYLQTITKGNSEAIYSLLGQEEALPAITALLTGGANDYAQALDGITHSAGAADEAFKKTSGGAQAAWQRATASLESLQIKIATALLPAVNAFSDKIAPLVNNVIDWIDKTNILNIVIGGTSSAFNYIASIGPSITAFFNNNKVAASALHTVMSDLSDVAAYVTLTFQQIGDTLENTYTTVYKWVASGQALRDILADLKPTLDYWGPKFQTIGDAIENSSVAVFHWVDSGKAIKDAMTGLQPAVDYLGPKFQSLGDSFAHLRDVAMPVLDRIGQAIGNLSKSVADSGVPMQIMHDIFTGIVFSIGLFADGIALLINGISNVITWFATGGSNLKWLWDMFAGIGAFLVSVFSPLWQQLVNVFQAQVVPAFAQLQPAIVQLFSAFQQLMPVFQIIGIIIGTVLVVALGILVGVISAVIAGIVGFVSGLAQVLGGIIQIISGVLQVIIGIVAFFIDLFTGNWSKLGADLGIIWQGIVTMFAGVWNVIAGIFMAAFGLLVGMLSGFVSGVVGFFTNLYNMLVGHSIIPDMINGIVDWFLKLPQMAIDAVQGLLGMMHDFFTNIATKALEWGGNIVKQIAAGITGGFDSVKNAIGNVGQFISDHLPHSPAKIGPLKDLRLQGSLIPEQIAQGMQKGIPQLQSVIGDLTTPISTSLSIRPLPAPDFAATPRGQSGNDQTQYLAQMVSLLAQIVTLQRQSGGNATTNNNVHINPVDAQRINQLIQSLGGYSYESVARGAF